MSAQEVKVWHHFGPELREARKNDDEVAFSRSIDEALGGSHIVRKRDMLIDGNEHGRSYNCMGQSTLGLNLIKGGKKWGVPEWVDDGIACLNVMLVDYEAGGLRLRDNDTETSYYCGKTSRSADHKGGTINKHLYATRTFLGAAEVMRDLGKNKLAAKFEDAGEEGFLKLVRGSHGPKLKDYFVRDEDGDFYLKSWTYYSLSNADKDRPYFLKYTEKNGRYHIFEMELIYAIGQWFEAGADTDGDFYFEPFFKPQVASLSALGAYLQVYDNKLSRGGLEEELANTIWPVRSHGEWRRRLVE